MRKLSEMAQARAMQRKAESKNRKTLRYAMRGSVHTTILNLDTHEVRNLRYKDYDSQTVGMYNPQDFLPENDPNAPKTINDILFEFEQTVQSHRTHVVKAKNLLISSKAEMSDELKDYWRQRIEHGAIKFDAGKLRK